MKATGVVRRIDDLGRIVIPKEIRKTLRIKEGEPLLPSLELLSKVEMYIEQIRENSKYVILKNKCDSLQ